MGLTKLLDIIIGLIIVLAVSITIWHFYSGNLKANVADNIAQETAYSYDTFAGALNSYVQANFNNNISGAVSCSALKADNFLSSGFSCTDPIGETLSGYISSPWGFPQTWLVVPTTTPNASVLSKFDINNALQWKSFTYMVAQDAMNENQNVKGFSVNGSNQFTMPDSDAISDLSDYFPSSNVEFPQAMPSIAYYDGSSIAVSPSMQKNPDYWLFNVSVTEDYNSASSGSSPASIAYTNLGSTAVCPVDGLMPVTQATDWEFNSGNDGVVGALYGREEIPSQTNYYNFSFYLCVPAAKSIINTASNIFSNIGPITSLNYGSDQVGITAGSGNTYSCPNGGALSGSSCTYAATATTGCPTGYTLSGGECTETVTNTQGYSCEFPAYRYGSCHGVWEGYACFVDSSPRCFQLTPTCPTGYTLHGGVNSTGANTYCTITSTETAPPTTTYSCPNGGALSGSSCTYAASVTANPSTYNGDDNAVEYVPPQVGRVYYITEGSAKYTFIVFWSAFSSGYYNSGSYDLVWGQFGQAAAVLWIGEPSSNSDICIESDGMQPAPEVSPEPYPPCWGAVNDLGLTAVSLE